MPKVDITPEQKAQYDAAAEEAFNKIAGLLADPSSFKQTKEDQGIKFFSRSDKDSPFSQVLSETTVNAPLDAVLKDLGNVPIYDKSMDKKVRGDCLIQESYVLDESDPNQDGFVYCGLDTPVRLVAKRDFLMYRKHFEKDGVHYFIHVSVDFTGVRPPTSDFVRGKILQVDIASADPSDSTKTKLQSFVHADPCGSIPAWVYNLTAESQGYDVKKVRDRVEAAQK
ncbi:hypothetical protein M9Y10_028622 [Tritrichomonas musculus]|uniref:START domain-containing protein n=1 Tax=Tritrichomonas musculus TaxID=1915356 RepID=A0ABR2KJU5_9EUKA